MVYSLREPSIRLSREPNDVVEVRRDRDLELGRLRRGVYVDRGEWDAAGREARHRAQISAAAQTRAGPLVFSHASAAILWGIPIVGQHLEAVHLIAFNRSRTHSQRGVSWHSDVIGDEDIDELAGFMVTSLERTLFDLARTLPFAAAVAALDYGIGPRLSLPVEADGGTEAWFAGVERQALLERADRQKGRRGVRLARASIEFCDALAESPGESISRAHMHQLGFPKPVLQQPFRRLDGGIDIADFDWPEYAMFGEFDGFGKYVREEFTHGSPIEEVVMEEKRREDRIRIYRPRAARWEWKHAISPPALRARLIECGLRPIR